MICVIGITTFIFIVQKSSDSIPIMPQITEKQVFNTNFENYIGRQKGSTIKSLMKTIISSNENNENQVTVDAKDIDVTFQNPDDIIKGINASSFYNVNVRYANNGFVNAIIITNIVDEINSNTENSTFTKTYNVLNVADSNDENYIYLTIRQFQEEEVKTVKVQRSLANGIEITKDYEFTFKYTDKKVEENIESIFTNTKLISIKQTDKQGLEQIQDSIR